MVGPILHIADMSAVESFRLPRGAQRRLDAKLRKQAAATAPVGKPAGAIIPVNKPMVAAPTASDNINMMVMNYPYATRTRRNVSGQPTQCKILTVSAENLERIVAKLSEQFAILSVLSLTHTCRTLADRISLCKIIKLNVMELDQAAPSMIATNDGVTPTHYNKTQYAQVQIDHEHPILQRYGISMDIRVLSQTSAVLKKSAASGIWSHSIRIDNGALTHVHYEKGRCIVALFHMGRDAMDFIEPMFKALDMPCLLGYTTTSCYTLGANISADDNKDEVIAHLIRNVEAAARGIPTDGAIVSCFMHPMKKMMAITRMACKWAAAITEIHQFPNQYVMRTIANEPIERWCTEYLHERVDAAFQKTAKLLA